MLGSAWVFLFLFLVAIGLAATSGVLVAIGSMGLLVAVGAWMWGRVAPARLSYRRVLGQGRAFPDEEVTLAIELTNRKRIPLAWVQIEDDFPEGLEITERPLEVTSRPRLWNLSHRTSIGPYERVRWSYRVRCARRGVYRLGPAHLRTGDVFGLFPQHVNLADQDSLLVYPRTVPLPELGLPARWPVGDRRGAQRLYQDPARPAGVRDYQPGDPMKHVDWKATARRNTLQVKVFEPGASLLTVALANVDTVGSPYGGAIPRHLERVVTVAASMCREALAAGQSVGMITNGKSVLYERPMSVPPGRNRQQLPLIFEALAMVTPFVGSLMEEELVTAARRLPPGATTVLITAVLTQELRHALELLLGERRAPLVLWVADWEPEGWPPGIVCRNLAPYLASLERDYDITA